MIDLKVSGTDSLRMTTKMIVQQALDRNWKVGAYYRGSSQLRLQRPDGKVLDIKSTTPPTTSMVAARRADDKYFTAAFLKDYGVAVPETYLVRADDDQAAKEAAQKIFDAGKKCVVKPLDSGHGNGITVALANQQQVGDALVLAKQFSDKIIIQENIDASVDVRIACIGYSMAAALIRVPARVQGDGQHTVSQLIDLANQHPDRGTDYAKRLNVISKDRAQAFLGDKMLQVPPAGQWVQVVGTANVGTGGETFDATDDIPQWLRQLAEKTAKLMDLPVCGVDFLLAAQPKSNSTPEQLKPLIIELNQCPSLFIHEMPGHGKSQPVVAEFLNYLEKL